MWRHGRRCTREPGEPRASTRKSVSNLSGANRAPCVTSCCSVANRYCAAADRMANRSLPPPVQLADPFGEHGRSGRRLPLQLLGGRFVFESQDPRLLQLVRWAYSGLPAHRFSTAVPAFHVRLVMAPAPESGSWREPRQTLLAGAGMLCAATTWSSSVIMSPGERTALLVITEEMLKFPYLVRYELIEFAVCTLAARAQGLVPLHAACVGLGGWGLLLVGDSGTGKSTIALHALLDGFDMLAEDSVYVAPRTLLATGIPNFMHVRAESLEFVAQKRDAAAIRNSPVIRRRSGVEKFEFDLRKPRFRLAGAPLKLAAVVVLSPKPARGRPAAATTGSRQDAGRAAGRPALCRAATAMEFLQQACIRT